MSVRHDLRKKRVNIMHLLGDNTSAIKQAHTEMVKEAIEETLVEYFWAGDNHSTMKRSGNRGKQE